MRSIDDRFYKTKLWEGVRESYLKKKHYICERCGEPAVIVHHRIHLTETNKTDDKIAYSENNLEALCINCHNKEHEVKYKSRKRYKVDEFGRIAPRFEKKI